MKAFHNPSLGLLLLRLGLGIIFVAHGAQKLFGAFGGFGIEGTTGFFASLGIPLPALMVYVVGIVEFVGGLMLIFGLLTPLVAAALAFDMLVSILLVRLPGGFFAPRGIEFELLLFLGSLTLVFAGAGRYSVDARRGRTEVPV